MDKQSIIALGSIVAFMFIMGFVGYMFSGDTPGASSNKRFTAKANTTRDKAMVLTSKRGKTESSENEAEDAKEGADGIKVRSFGSLTPKDPEPSESDQAIQEALNGMTPEEGIQRLEREMERLHTAAESAALCEAVAKLLMRENSANSQSALQTFERALAMAPTTEMRRRIALSEARLQAELGDVSAARARLQSVLEEDSAVTATALKVRVELSNLEMRAGNRAKAIRGYKEALDLGLNKTGPLDDETKDAMRLAALRLSKALREEGRASEATEIAAQFRERVEDIAAPTLMN
jgi:tetratricopeptide (TPR) repeat protein